MGEAPFHVALLSGGAAGTTVDIVLFPLDTLKTRMQSSQGFMKAGGFRGIYKGISAAASGSAAALSQVGTLYTSLVLLAYGANALFRTQYGFDLA